MKKRSHFESMNHIGIGDNLNRSRIKKLLIIGLFASIMTGIGDYLVGYGPEIPGDSFASKLMANIDSISDAQLIWGSLLGLIGLFLEGLAMFGIYRLMADKAPEYAHIYRSGIFGYIWLAPIGCHMNLGIFNIAYRYLRQFDPVTADRVLNKVLYAFSVPVWILLILFWLPAIIVQFKAFGESKTPYPAYAKWFNVLIGMIPALLIGMLIGLDTALGPAIGTTFLSCGNAIMFSGLLATLPSKEIFDSFKNSLEQ